MSFPIGANSQVLDTISLNIMFNKVSEIAEMNRELCHQLLDSIDSVLRNTERNDYKVKSYVFRGNIYKNFNDFQYAEDYYKKAEAILGKNPEREIYITWMVNRGSNFFNLNQHDEALRLSKYVIEKCRENSEFDLVSASLANFTIGRVLESRGDISALTYIKRSEELLKRTKGHERKLGAIYYYLARLYKRMGDVEKMIYYCQLADNFLPPNSYVKHSVLNVWAQALHEKGFSQEAEKIYHRILDDKSLNDRTRVFALNSLGILLKDSERYDEASVIFLEGLEYAEREKLDQKKGEILANLAGLYFAQNDYLSALKYYKASRDIFFDENSTASLDHKIYIIEMIIRSGLANNEYYPDLDQYINLRDTLDNQNLKGNLSEILVKYEDEKKQKEISELRNKNLLKSIDNLKLNEINSLLEQDKLAEKIIASEQKRISDSLDNLVSKSMFENNQLISERQYQQSIISLQRQFLSFGGAGLALISLLSLLLFKQSRKRKALNETLQSQKNKILILNQELNHRVKNNLAFMSSLLEMQARRISSPEVKQALLESESRLRALALVHAQLFKSEQDTEINLKFYLQEILTHLNQVFKLPDTSIYFKTDLIDYDIDAEEAMRIGLIVNELVTNSVKYAFTGIQQPEIKIRTSITENKKLLFEYADNGPGRENTNPNFSKPEALGEKLIGLLKAQLGEKYVFLA